MDIDWIKEKVKSEEYGWMKKLGGRFKMYKYDDCSLCGGRVTERKVQKVCFWGEKIVALMDNVPAGVCEQCGEKYYKAKILKAIENLLKNKRKFDIEIKVPVADFALELGRSSF